MASTSETGHSKNVANMDQLVSFTLGYGPAYNPSKNSLKTESLVDLSKNAKNAIIEVALAFPIYGNAVADRELSFKPLGILATRLLNAIKATDTSSQVVENAKTLIRKIQGRRATPKKTPDQKKALEAKGIQVVEISASQMSFDGRLESFDKLIKLLNTLPTYTPNEPELKIDALLMLYANLKGKNEAVVNAIPPLSNARLMRNNILYNEKTGLVDTAMDAKAYIKSLFGAVSSQYRQVSGLAFKTLKN